MRRLYQILISLLIPASVASLFLVGTVQFALMSLPLLTMVSLAQYLLYWVPLRFLRARWPSFDKPAYLGLVALFISAGVCFAVLYRMPAPRFVPYLIAASWGVCHFLAVVLLENMSRKTMPVIGLILVKSLAGACLTGVIYFWTVSTLWFNQTVASAQVRALACDVDRYRAHLGTVPDESEWTRELLENTNGSTEWRGPYADASDFVDPWKGQVIYHRIGESFELVSYGADGKKGGFGNDADVVAGPLPCFTQNLLFGKSW